MSTKLKLLTEPMCEDSCEYDEHDFEVLERYFKGAELVQQEYHYASLFCKRCAMTVEVVAASDKPLVELNDIGIRR